MKNIKEKEKEIISSDNDFEKFFELSLNLLCVAGTDAKFKRINPEFAKLLGYTTEELLQIPFIDLIHPDDREKTVEAVSELSEGKDVVNFENRYICKNGNLLNIRWTAAPEASEGKIFAVGVDVTEERAEQYLKKKIEGLRSLYISSKQRNNQFWDNALEVVLEVTESEYGFIGEIKHTEEGAPYLKTFSITDISWDEETRKFFEEKSKDGLEFYNLETLFGEVIKTGQNIIANDPKNHPKAAGIPMGHPALNAFLGVPMHYAGKFVGMVGVANRKGGYDETLLNSLKETFQTISSIIHAYLLERNLKEADELNRLYKESIDNSSMVSIMDINGVLIHVNDMFCRISGYRRSDLIGKKYEDFISPTYTKNKINNMWRDIKNGGSWSGELCKRDRTGKEYWVSKNVTSLKNHIGDIDRFISIAKDITKEREQNKLELEFQRVQESTRAKSEFLSTMSHEIRTPLNGVIGMVELLKESGLNEEQLKIINTITNSGRTLLSIVNDILDLSKIESGKIVFYNKKSNLSKFLEELVRPFDFSCKEKNINFSYSCNEFNHYVLVDEGRIGQVVTNIVSNAIKFTKEGEVSIALTQKRENDNLVSVSIEVSDTGAGVPEHFIEKIYEPFTQNIIEGIKPDEGTGLGLSIARKIIDSLNGEINIKSKEGEGSTFTVTFNTKLDSEIISTDKVQRNTKIKNMVKDKNSKHILIAEDNPTNQVVISSFVEKIGHTYKIVGNGSEAFSALEQDNFDLVLMDCQMPLVDGYEAVKMIRQCKKKFKDIPVIALTANAIKGDDKRCFESGMNGYLTKPITSHQLEREMNRFFEPNNFINIRTLEKLRDEDFSGQIDILYKTLNTYINTSALQIKEIILLFNKQDLSTVKYLAHSLRSSSEMLGAENLAQLCKTLEESGQNELINRFNIVEFEEVANGTLNEFQKVLDQNINLDQVL